MAYVFADVEALIRVYADAKDNDHFEPDDIRPLANAGIESLYRKLTGVDPTLYFDEVDFVLAGGSDGSGVELSCRALHGVDKDPDTAQRRTIRARPFRERNRLAGAASWAPAPYHPTVSYDQRGQRLVFSPYEQAAGNYRAYIQQAPTLFSADDPDIELDPCMEPWVEYIAVFAARQMLAIEESDTTAVDLRLAQLSQEIDDDASRDNGPSYIAIVDDDCGWRR